jgi:tetratricopeptide (TPR) repeat protein
MVIDMNKVTKLNGKVKVTEDTLIIPTYLVNPPNPMPRFYEGVTHEGTQRLMYPYPMNDNLTRVKEAREYPIIYLENEFIKIGVMPCLGGRIFEAVDKTNGYDFFYRQNVIKPALIGMLGYWLSGGLAWGFPHHHGPNTVEPMDYTVKENSDGSVTVWVTYTEFRHRMRILVGYSIYPDSSVCEMTIRPSNPTPYLNSFLFWANPAVECNTNYQVIFSPSVKYVTHHHKHEMTSWPVADRTFNGFDFNGLDISMWKNTKVPSSFFSWDPHEGFFGGYDHGKQAGTAWIGNHHTCPGMKYWADGNNAAGEVINDDLTDEDGRYLELMAGAYSDNQPDYSWIQPYENKDITMIWYPIRHLGGMKEANKNAALNIDTDESGKISVRLNTTSRYQNAEIILLYNGVKIFHEKVDVSPDKPYSKDIVVKDAIKSELLKFTFCNSSNDIILEYQPKISRQNPLPEPLGPIPAPEDVTSVEELYLHGLRLDQFFNAPVRSNPYYLEALKRDPGDYRVNTQIGILYCKRKMFKEAEKYLKTAKDRITMRYTRAKDSEAHYYLGIVQRKLNKNDEAYSNFYDATWNAGWNIPAYHQLAEIDCENKNYASALDHINRALASSIDNLKSQCLKVVILRKMGRYEESKNLAEMIIEKDPLDFQSMYELFLLNTQINQKSNAESALKHVESIMQNKTQTYLELSTGYGNCGFYEEAIHILSQLEKKGDQFPMLFYYLGYYWSKLDNEKNAKHYFQQAQLKPHDYCFPFRDESVDVLNEAINYYPDDAKAFYYLGNLYYELQPQKSISLWEKSMAIDDSFYIVQRNLALAIQEHEHNLDKAIDLFKKSFTIQKDPRLMYEYDVACEMAKMSPADRFKQIFMTNRAITTQRSETYIREIELLIFLGKYDEVIDILSSVKLFETEVSYTYRDIFHNAYILKSLSESKAGNFTAAIGYLEKLLNFPLVESEAQRRAQLYYLLGIFYGQTGNEAKSKYFYEKAINENVEGTEYHFEKGLALLRTGQKEKALLQFNSLLEISQRKEESDIFRSFGKTSPAYAKLAQAEYLKGLSYLGMNNKSEAKSQFELALKLNPAHLWANFMLNEANGGLSFFVSA